MEGYTGRQTHTQRTLLWGPSFPLHQILDLALGRKRSRHSEIYSCPDDPSQDSKASPPLQIGVRHTRPPEKPPPIPTNPADPPQTPALPQHRRASGPKHLQGSCGRSSELTSFVETGTTWGRASPKTQRLESKCQDPNSLSFLDQKTLQTVENSSAVIPPAPFLEEAALGPEMTGQ